MENIELNDWEDFLRGAKSVQDNFISTNGHESLNHSPFLFRGQHDASWPLESTLGRYTSKSFRMSDYHNLMNSLNRVASSLSPNSYDIADNFLYNGMSAPPAYELMVHLRHHGFPSPLLDWTRSIYIAAFFAFWKARPDSNVAIFCFKEYMKMGKVWSSSSPHINGLGPYLKTHARHHIQQAQYTICIIGDKSDPTYCGYENVAFGNHQDYLIKYTLPSTLRTHVLKELDKMNINAFSLFNNEEGLMDMLAFRELTEQ